METLEHYKFKLEAVQQKFDKELTYRYKCQTDEYENELELELEERESKIISLTEKYTNLLEETHTLKQKYTSNENEIVSLLNQKDNLLEELESMRVSKRELEHQNDQLEQTVRILTHSVQDLSEQLFEAKEAEILLKEELEVTKLAGNTSLDLKKEEIHQINQDTQSENIEEDSLTKVEYPPIKILARFKENHQWNPTFTLSENSVQLVKCRERDQKTFEFHRVFGGDSNSHDVFFEIQTSIFKALTGGSACLLAYGETGSGKTTSIAEMIRMTIQHLDCLLTNIKKKVKISFVEVYNELAHDFLKKSKFTKDWKKLMKDSEIEIFENWASESEKLLEDVLRCRSSVSEKNLSNRRSSRSHFIFSLTLELEFVTGKIVFVDLAGSERISKISMQRDSLKENLFVNKSLSALHSVLFSLYNKRPRIAYKESLLTEILEPILSLPNMNLTLLLTCKPDINSIQETLSTLSVSTQITTPPKLRINETNKLLILLENERNEKLNLKWKVDKLERDIASYIYTLEAKDSELNSLQKTLSKQNRQYEKQTEVIQKLLSRSISIKEETTKQIKLLNIQTEIEKAVRRTAFEDLQQRERQWRISKKEKSSSVSKF